ncbi:MAG: peptidase S8, partial [Thermoproteota archaeon]
PFDNFMNKTDVLYANDMKISSLYLYDWIDKNNDTNIASDELSMINRAGSWGTVQELRITEPNEQFKGTPLVGVYPTPTRYSYYLGDTKHNSTSMEYTLSASYYQKDKWSVIWPESETITVPANNTAKVDISLVVPNDLQTGNYQGFITFEGKTHTVNAPVSFVVKKEIDHKDSLILIQGKYSDDIIFGNGYVKGAFDMVNRYMAGDWRQYYFDIKDDSINSAAIELSWKTDDTNLSVFVMDPKGKIIQTNMPSGVFGHFLGWPSLDWLGTSLFSQGGGFFPVKNKDDTSTVLYVPINQTGTYTLLAHSTLFGGNSTTEPITLAAKFSNISSEIQPIQDNSIKTEIISDSIKNVTISEFSYKTIRNDSQIIISDDTNDSSFNIGLTVGIGVGIAIGIIIFVILRQKPNLIE